jgi:putative membrane protein
MYPMRGGINFGLIFGVIFWILFIFLIIGLVRWYVADNKESDDEQEDSSRALQILKERYAKGEISSKEFEKMKKDIA